MAQLANDYYNTLNPVTNRSIFEQMVDDAGTYPTNSNLGQSTPWPLVYGALLRAKYLDSISVSQYLNHLSSFLRKDGNGARTALSQVRPTFYP